MDYSLLVGLHFRETATTPGDRPGGESQPPGSSPLPSLAHLTKLSLTNPRAHALLSSPAAIFDRGSNSSETTPRLSRADMDQLLCDPTRSAEVNPDSSSTQLSPALPEAPDSRFAISGSLTGRWATIRLGVNMPARVEQTQQQRCEGESPPPVGETFDVVLFFGIIDILQDYDISKKLEHAYKSIQYDPTSISAVDPKQYSRRFRDFIFKVFRDDP